MTRRKSMSAREPNGQTKRSQREQVGPAPAAMARLRDAALSRMADPVWETMLGRLHMSKRLTSAQFAAGRYWAELARDYAVITAAPKYPRSVDLEPNGGTPADPDSAVGRREARREAQTIHRYLASLAMLNHTGEAARGAVVRVCEQDQFPIGVKEMEGLRSGLQALADWYAGGARK